MLARVDDGTDLAPTKITVAEWLRRWLADYASMTAESLATVERYEAVVEQHIIPIIGALPLRQLRTAQIQGLYADRLTDGRLRGDGGLSKRTVHHLHRLLNNAMSTAVTEGLIASNPCSTAKSPKPDTPDIVFLDDDQTATMLMAAMKTRSPNIYALVVLAVTTGMRRGELLALRWRDVDIEAGTVKVEATLEDTKTGLRFKPPKTKTSRRSLNLPAFAITVLRDHKMDQAQLRLQLGIGADDNRLVFERYDRATDTFGPLRPRNVTKAFDRFIKTVDVPRITLHGLRHTHATSAIRAGENIVAVSRRLGHASPSITLDVYAHAIPNDAADLAENLNRRLAQLLLT